MNDELDDLFRRRGDVEPPSGFADRVMDAVHREPPPAKGVPALLSSPAVRVAACVLAGLACVYRMAAVVAVFVAR
jgi:hypothetical protein